MGKVGRMEEEAAAPERASIGWTVGERASERAGREEMETESARDGEESESGGRGRRLERERRTGKRDFSRGQPVGGRERETCRISRRWIATGRHPFHQRILPFFSLPCCRYG